MATTLTDLLSRWDSNDGKPYKGSLIDWDAYEANPDSIGCMCAQGQALHVLAGWSPEKLRDTRQAVADRETAKLLNISLSHAILLRGVNDRVDGAPSIVLTDPAKVIGDQADKILDFWAYLDGMTADQRDAARAAAWDAAGDATWAAAWDAAWDAAGDAAGAAAWDAAGAAAWDAAGDAAWDAAGDATWAAAGAAAWAAVSEIMGSRLLREQGREFYFLPMFGFASPDEIPARPVGYGVVEAA